jgi:hypothetical protein
MEAACSSFDDDDQRRRSGGKGVRWRIRHTFGNGPSRLVGFGPGLIDDGDGKNARVR